MQCIPVGLGKIPAFEGQMRLVPMAGPTFEKACPTLDRTSSTCFITPSRQRLHEPGGSAETSEDRSVDYLNLLEAL